MNLAGKRALVTGASRGIGAAIAKAGAEAPARELLSFLTSASSRRRFADYGFE